MNPEEKEEVIDLKNPEEIKSLLKSKISCFISMLIKELVDDKYPYYNLIEFENN